jgi:hypothetical protein
MLTILQFSNIQKATNHKNYSIVTLNLYNNMQFQVLSPQLLMICMESAYNMSHSYMIQRDLLHMKRVMCIVLGDAVYYFKTVNIQIWGLSYLD